MGESQTLSRWKASFQVRLRLLASHPVLLVAPLLLLCTLLGVGLWAVIDSSQREEARHLRRAVSDGQEIKDHMMLHMEVLYRPVSAVGTMIRLHPRKAELEKVWNQATMDALDQIPAVLQPETLALLAAPLGSLRLAVGTSTVKPMLQSLIGMQMHRLNPSSRQAVTNGLAREVGVHAWRSAQAEGYSEVSAFDFNTTVASGSGSMTDAEHGSSVMGSASLGINVIGPMVPYPLGPVTILLGRLLFLPVNSSTENWGLNDSTIADLCGASACYHNATGFKFWGSVTLGVNLEKMLSVCFNSLVHKMDYEWVLVKSAAGQSLSDSPSGSSKGHIIARSADVRGGDWSAAWQTYKTAPIPVSDMKQKGSWVTTPIQMQDSLWELHLTKEGGWTPAWRDPLIAMVVIVSVLLSLLLLFVLMEQHRKKLLLKVLVPKNVIRHMLHNTSDWVSQSPDPGWMDQGTPAGKILGMVAGLLQGQLPSTQDALLVRTAVLQGVDLYKPVGGWLEERMAQHDSEVAGMLALSLGLGGSQWTGVQQPNCEVISPGYGNLGAGGEGQLMAHDDKMGEQGGDAPKVTWEGEGNKEGQEQGGEENFWGALQALMTTRTTSTTTTTTSNTTDLKSSSQANMPALAGLDTLTHLQNGVRTSHHRLWGSSYLPVSSDAAGLRGVGFMTLPDVSASAPWPCSPTASWQNIPQNLLCTSQLGHVLHPHRPPPSGHTTPAELNSGGLPSRTSGASHFLAPPLGLARTLRSPYSPCPQPHSITLSSLDQRHLLQTLPSIAIAAAQAGGGHGAQGSQGSTPSATLTGSTHAPAAAHPSAIPLPKADEMSTQMAANLSAAANVHSPTASSFRHAASSGVGGLLRHHGTSGVDSSLKENNSSTPSLRAQTSLRQGSCSHGPSGQLEGGAGIEEEGEEDPLHSFSVITLDQMQSSVHTAGSNVLTAGSNVQVVGGGGDTCSSRLLGFDPMGLARDSAGGNIPTPCINTGVHGGALASCDLELPSDTSPAAIAAAAAAAASHPACMSGTQVPLTRPSAYRSASSQPNPKHTAPHRAGGASQVGANGVYDHSSAQGPPSKAHGFIPSVVVSLFSHTKDSSNTVNSTADASAGLSTLGLCSAGNVPVSVSSNATAAATATITPAPAPAKQRPGPSKQRSLGGFLRRASFRRAPAPGPSSQNTLSPGIQGSRVVYDPSLASELTDGMVNGRSARTDGPPLTAMTSAFDSLDVLPEVNDVSGPYRVLPQQAGLSTLVPHASASCLTPAAPHTPGAHHPLAHTHSTGSAPPCGPDPHPHYLHPQQYLAHLQAFYQAQQDPMAAGGNPNTQHHPAHHHSHSHIHIHHGSNHGSDHQVTLAPATPPVPPPVMEEVETLLAAASSSWYFDSFALASATRGHPLSVLAYYIIVKETQLASHLKIPLQPLARWLKAVEAGYKPNPYHNATHAADVLQTLHMVITQSGLLPSYADPLTHLACYLSAAVHDYEHEGLTNDFLVATSHPLAMRYNDRSPLENHHVAASLSLMALPGHNLAEALPKPDRDRLRRTIIDLVLGTDMKQHIAITSRFATMHHLGSQGQVQVQGQGAGGSRKQGVQGGQGLEGAGNQSRSRHSPESGVKEVKRPLQPSDDAERVLGLQMALKCCDVGHICESEDVHKRWVAGLEEEMFLQGDAEKAAGLPVSPLFDRDKPGVTKSQQGFFEFVVFPLLKAFVHVFPGCQPMLTQATSNYRIWCPAPTSLPPSNPASSPPATATNTAEHPTVSPSASGRAAAVQAPDMEPHTAPLPSLRAAGEGSSEGGSLREARVRGQAVLQAPAPSPASLSILNNSKERLHVSFMTRLSRTRSSIFGGEGRRSMSGASAAAAAAGHAPGAQAHSPAPSRYARKSAAAAAVNLELGSPPNITNQV